MKHSHFYLDISWLTANLCKNTTWQNFNEDLGFHPWPHPFIGNSSWIDGVRFIIHLKERLTKSIVGQAASNSTQERLSRVHVASISQTQRKRNQKFLSETLSSLIIYTYSLPSHTSYSKPTSRLDSSTS